jgi:hypothetical protein
MNGNANAKGSSGLALPPGDRTVLRALPAMLLGAALCGAGASSAFTFADGTTLQCIAAGQPVAEYDAPPGHKLIADSHTGLVERNGTGYRIAWNPAKLATLPPEVHDFIFFHECAHASVPTQDELMANCVGLKAMRAAGRAGVAVEMRLASFYGRGSEYWSKTIACANAGDDPRAPPAAR